MLCPRQERTIARTSALCGARDRRRNAKWLNSKLAQLVLEVLSSTTDHVSRRILILC